MENKEKVIGGIDLSTWKQAFAQATAIAISKDYFSDILFDGLYPDTHEEAGAIDEENEEAIDEVYNSKWKFVDEAFKEVFGISLNGEEE